MKGCTQTYQYLPVHVLQCTLHYEPKLLSCHRKTREERCTFPVGTDRPARRQPAALDRPSLARPLLGPVAGCRLGPQRSLGTP